MPGYAGKARFDTGATSGAASSDSHDTASSMRLPCPHLERIDQVQLPRQFAAAELEKIAHEIAVDVVGVIFVSANDPSA